MNCKYCGKQTPKLKRSSKYFCNYECNLLNNIQKVESGCWINTAGLRKDGYCNFPINGKQKLAHRVMYELKNGEIKDKEKIVCHTCDNRQCCNPEHIYLGTHSLNALDRQKRNSNSLQNGEKNRNSKLSDKDILDIRMQLQCGNNKKDLSKKYNVTFEYLKRIARGAVRQITDVRIGA